MTTRHMSRQECIGMRRCNGNSVGPPRGTDEALISWNLPVRVRSMGPAHLVTGARSGLTVIIFLLHPTAVPTPFVTPAFLYQRMYDTAGSNFVNRIHITMYACLDNINLIAVPGCPACGVGYIYVNIIHLFPGFIIQNVRHTTEGALIARHKWSLDNLAMTKMVPIRAS